MSDASWVNVRQVDLQRLEGRIAELEAALVWFANLADTWTVQTAAKADTLLTLGNGERMCGISAQAFINAQAVLRKSPPK